MGKIERKTTNDTTDPRPVPEVSIPCFCNYVVEYHRMRRTTFIGKFPQKIKREIIKGIQECISDPLCCGNTEAMAAMAYREKALGRSIIAGDLQVIGKRLFKNNQSLFKPCRDDNELVEVNGIAIAAAAIARINDQAARFDPDALADAILIVEKQSAENQTAH